MVVLRRVPLHEKEPVRDDEERCQPGFRLPCSLYNELKAVAAAESRHVNTQAILLLKQGLADYYRTSSTAKVRAAR